MKEIKTKDVMVFGFALFAIFFGAGNLIFPPYLGACAGDQWTWANIGYLIADVGVTFLGIVAAALAGGKANDITHKLGAGVGNLMSALIYLCIGPLLAIPRTAATTHEVVFQGKDVSPVITSVVFFSIALIFTLRPSKIVDIIGKILTPTLLTLLVIMIITGIVTPLGQPQPSDLPISTNITTGIKEGYQTMDGLAAIATISLIVASILDRGYSKEQIPRITIKSGLVAVVTLGLAYTGLTYLGATFHYSGEIPDRTGLLVGITNGLLGSGGHLVLSITMSLACLTTAIGLTSAASEFFSGLSKGKISYKAITIAICIFSGVFSVVGVNSIISFAAPILEILYPCVLVLIVLCLLGDRVPTPRIYHFGVLGALLISAPLTLGKLFGWDSVVESLSTLPLGELGSPWIVPALIGVLVGWLAGKIRPVAKKA